MKLTEEIINQLIMEELRLTSETDEPESQEQQADDWWTTGNISMPVSNNSNIQADQVISAVTLSNEQTEAIDKILNQNKQLLSKQALPTFKLTDHWLSSGNTGGRFLFDVARAKLQGLQATEALSSLCLFIRGLQQNQLDFNNLTHDQFIAKLMFAQTFYTFMKGMQAASGGFIFETFLASFLAGGQKLGGNQEVVDVKQTINIDGTATDILYSLKLKTKLNSTDTGFKIGKITKSSLADNYASDDKIVLLVGAKDKPNYPDVVEFGYVVTTAGAYASENFGEAEFQWIGNKEQSTIDFSGANLDNFLNNARAYMKRYHQGLDGVFEHFHNFKVLISTYYSTWEIPAALGAAKEYESLKTSINKGGAIDDVQGGGSIRLSEDVAGSFFSSSDVKNATFRNLKIKPPSDSDGDEEKLDYSNVITAQTVNLMDAIQSILNAKNDDGNLYNSYKNIHDYLFNQVTKGLPDGDFKTAIERNIKQIKSNFAKWVDTNISKIPENKLSSVVGAALENIIGISKTIGQTNDLQKQFAEAILDNPGSVIFDGIGKITFDSSDNTIAKILNKLRNMVDANLADIKTKFLDYFKKNYKSKINWKKFVGSTRKARLFTKDVGSLDHTGKIKSSGKLFDLLLTPTAVIEALQGKLFTLYMTNLKTSEEGKIYFYKLGNDLKKIADKDKDIPSDGSKEDFYKDVADDESPANVLDDSDIISVATDPSDDHYNDIANAAFSRTGTASFRNLVSKYINPDKNKRPEAGLSWENIAYNFNVSKDKRASFIASEVGQILSDERNQKAFGAAEGLPVYNIDESFGRVLDNKTMVPLLFKKATEEIQQSDGTTGLGNVPLFTTIARCCTFLNKITDSGTSFTLQDMSSVLSKLTLMQSFTSMVEGGDEGSVMGFYLESFFAALIKGGTRGGSNLDLIDVYQLPNDGSGKYFYSLKFYIGNPDKFATTAEPSSSKNLVKAAFGETVHDRFKLDPADLEQRVDPQSAAKKRVSDRKQAALKREINDLITKEYSKKYNAFITYLKGKSSDLKKLKAGLPTISAIQKKNGMKSFKKWIVSKGPKATVKANTPQYHLRQIEKANENIAEINTKIPLINKMNSLLASNPAMTNLQLANTLGVQNHQTIVSLRRLVNKNYKTGTWKSNLEAERDKLQAKKKALEANPKHKLYTKFVEQLQVLQDLYDKIEEKQKELEKEAASLGSASYLPVHIIAGIKDSPTNPTKIAFGYQKIESPEGYEKMKRNQFQPITADPSDCILDLANFQMAKRTAYSIMQNLGIDINGIFKGINDFKILYTYYLLNPTAKTAGIAAMKSIKAARDLINKSFDVIKTSDSSQSGLQQLTESILDHLIMEVMTENRQKPKQNKEISEIILDKLIQEVILKR